MTILDITGADPRRETRLGRTRSRMRHALGRALRRIATTLGSPQWRRRSLVAATLAAVLLVAGLAWDFRPTGTTRLAALVRPANTALTRWITTPVAQRPPISVPLASVTGLDVKIYNAPSYGTDWDVAAAAKSYAQVVDDLHQYPYQSPANASAFERKLEQDVDTALKASATLEADLTTS